MFKVLSVLAALWLSAVTCEECLYQMELWSAEDPTKFYYCNPDTNTRVIADCLPNTGFVKNDTVSGCIPWDAWSDTCVSKIDESQITCGENTFLQPQGAVNPQLFYLCTGQDSAPVQLHCAADRGFYSGKEYLGCFPWNLWRTLTGCLA